MKRDCAARKGKRALRFIQATASASWQELPLHVCGANASLRRYSLQKFIFRAMIELENDKLREQSMDFAVQIINLVKQLKAQKENIISNQIGRSGTSIGANIREAKYAHGTADFVSKLQIALKEANETGYWLELLYKTNYISGEQYKSFESKCKSLRAMLVSSLNTAKTNL